MSQLDIFVPNQKSEHANTKKHQLTSNPKIMDQSLLALETLKAVKASVEFSRVERVASQIRVECFKKSSKKPKSS